MKSNSQNLSLKPTARIRNGIKWSIIGLPLAGIIGTSFLPIQAWMQQALILLTLVWFYVFFLMDTFFMGG